MFKAFLNTISSNTEHLQLIMKFHSLVEELLHGIAKDQFFSASYLVQHSRCYLSTVMIFSANKCLQQL